MRLWEPSISRPEHASVLPRILAKALAGALEKRNAPGALVVTPPLQRPKVPYLNGKKWEFAVSVAMGRARTHPIHDQRQPIRQKDLSSRKARWLLPSSTVRRMSWSSS